MKTNKQHQSFNTNLKFVDFSSFEELSRHPEILHSLITDYCNIFSEPDVWNEHYSHAEILKKLEHELVGHAALRLCIDKDNGSVVGFCWVQLLNADDITAAIQSVHFYKALGSPNIDHSLYNIIGKHSVIYVQDLGVSKHYRGTIPLEQLICPVIETVSQQAKTRNIFFWSVEDTCVAWLAQKIGINVAMSLGKMQFFKGKFPSLNNLVQLER